MNAPANARYLDSHEYAVPADGTVTVGISPYAVEQLGDVVYVELPAVGTQLKKGQTFGVVESVKAVSDLYAPISGEVTAANTALVDDPAVIATDAFTHGWMIKIKPSNEAELEGLMTSEAYANFIGSH
jgi:glycine cleavage system H protein